MHGTYRKGLTYQELDSLLVRHAKDMPRVMNGGGLQAQVQQVLAGGEQRPIISVITTTPVTDTKAPGARILNGAAADTVTIPLPVAGPISSGGDDGKIINYFVNTAHAHVVTTSANGFNGNTATATSAGAIGNTLTLMAWNGQWCVIGNSGFTLS